MGLGQIGTELQIRRCGLQVPTGLAVANAISKSPTANKPLRKPASLWFEDGVCISECTCHDPGPALPYLRYSTARATLPYLVLSQSSKAVAEVRKHSGYLECAIPDVKIALLGPSHCLLLHGW